MSDFWHIRDSLIINIEHIVYVAEMRDPEGGHLWHSMTMVSGDDLRISDEELTDLMEYVNTRAVPS